MTGILGTEAALLHLENIRASSRTTHLFGMLRTTTGIGPEAWARLAICLSIRQRGVPNPDEYNKEGSEFSPTRLFPDDKNLYFALMINRLKHDGLDPDTYLTEMTRAHLNRGAISLKQRIDSLFDIYGFINEMNAGKPGTKA